MSARRALVSSLLLFACSGGDGGPPDATIDAEWPGEGRLRVSWTVADDNGPATCAAVGATTVFLREVPVGSSDDETDAFPCDSGTGVTQARPAGTYNVLISLIDNFGGIYGGDVRSNVVIPADGSTVDLAPVAFVVQPPGSFTLSVDADAAGANCAPVASGGAGITAMTLRLWNVDGQCVTRDVDIGDGPTSMAPGFTATTVCLPDADHAGDCIENDQLFTFPLLPVGSYAFRVTAWIGTPPATDCFAGLANLVVDSDMVQDLGTITLQRDATNPACAP